MEAALATLLVSEVSPFTLGGVCRFLQDARERVARMAEVVDAAKDLQEAQENVLYALAADAVKQEWDNIPPHLRSADMLTDEELDELGILPEDEDDQSICAARLHEELKNEFGLHVPKTP